MFVKSPFLEIPHTPTRRPILIRFRRQSSLRHQHITLHGNPISRPLARPYIAHVLGPKTQNSPSKSAYIRKFPSLKIICYHSEYLKLSKCLLFFFFIVLEAIYFSFFLFSLNTFHCSPKRNASGGRFESRVRVSELFHSLP